MPEEDKLLVKCYLFISQDCIGGVEQQETTFWKRVESKFLEHDKNKFGSNSEGLKNCWGVIQRCVNKFCGCYLQICARKESGKVEEDCIADAHQLYFKQTGSQFKMEVLWVILRDHQKWKETLASSNTSNKNIYCLLVRQLLNLMLQHVQLGKTSKRDQKGRRFS